jgi:Phytanoyl-CoA dioxygenase (PhyH)
MNAWGDGPRRFASEGYAVYPGVIDARVPCPIARGSGPIARRADALTETTWAGPVRWLILSGKDGRPVLRGLQFPYRISAIYDDVRTHPMIQRILSPLIGLNLVSVLGTLFWKPAGAAKTVIAYHQDSSFRKPAEKFRNLASSYVQVGLALDPHGPDNGGMRFVAGSHKLGELATRRTASVMTEAPTDRELARLGFSPDQTRDVELDAGDVVVWHPHLLHGSPPNRSAKNDRLLYVIAYMKRADTDAGDLAFVDGKPCAYARDGRGALQAN